MNIHDAAKSGKPFTQKRYLNPMNPIWYFFDPHGVLCCSYVNFYENHEIKATNLDKNGLLADDWITKED